MTSPDVELPLDESPAFGAALKDARVGRRAMLFSREDLLRVLHGFNPWWSHRAIALPKFRRAAYGACRRHLESRSEAFVLLLSGLRGTGKTTLLLQLATDLVAAGAEPRSVLYLGMSHPVLGRVPLSEILRLYREMVHAEESPAVLLLDAMHCARDWDQQVKRLLVVHSGYRIIATESVQTIEQALVTETQVGRWSAMSAPPLSFYEYLSLLGLQPDGVPERLEIGRRAPTSTSDLVAAAAAVRPAAAHFRSYLANGGLPWLAALSKEESRNVLHEDLAESILRRDIAVHFGARDVEDLKRLFVYLCIHSGDVFPVQRYAKSVGTSAATVASHLELLERCFLVRKLPPVVLRGAVVQKARHRVFITDTTLRNAQLLLDADHLTDPDEMRRVVETCVARHVVERFASSTTRVGYWRDARTGRSVDAVVQAAEGAVVFQNMYHDRAPLSERDGVVHFCRSERVPRAYLVTRDEDDIGVFRRAGHDTEFVRIPAHLLAYLLGRAESRAAAE